MWTIFTTFARTKAGMSVLGLLGILLVALALIAFGAHKERKAEEARDAIAVAAAQAVGAAASDKATQAVQAEAAQIAEARKALVDEVVQVADGPPTTADVLYGCRELQRNGIRTSNLPACLALEDRGGTSTKR